jgi:tRNA-2-methylthio-N6-dimethylallyladenosine synthase
MAFDNSPDISSQTGRDEYSAKAKVLLGGKRYHIITYGCQMNAHDSEKIAGMLQSIGMAAAGTQEDADLILINTCCVREHAENRVYGNVGALVHLKREKPGLLIGVCGCMMQQENAAAKLVSKMKHVNFVFGTHNLHELPQMLVGAMETSKSYVRISKDENSIVEGIPAARAQSVSAYVTIMYGCDNFCSYCIVPHVRGRERSREPATILSEIQTLADSGVREVTLLGQNVNSYGAGADIGFPELLEKIEREVNDLTRVRFMTSHPKDLSDRLIEVMAGSKIVCKQIHLPVQSGSDRILQQMNRRYTSGHYLELLAKLRAAMPGIGVSSDFIVGFPGETEEDFKATLRLVETARLNSSYTFKYSRRTGTAAAKMENQIPEDVKKERLARINALQIQISAELDRQAVGRLEEVLVESQSKRRSGEVSGRTDSGRMVNFVGGPESIGKLVTVKISKALANTLYGEQLPPSHPV